MIFKKALIIGISTIGTIGAVAGVGTGIAYVVQEQNAVNHKDETFTNPQPTQPNNKPTTNKKDEPLADAPAKEEGEKIESAEVAKLSIEEVVKHLKEKDALVIRPIISKANEEIKVDSSQKLEVKDLFAFDIKVEQIQLVDPEKWIKGFDITFEIDTDKNKLETYNDGELSLKATVKDKDPKGSKEAQTVEIKLTDFKKAEGLEWFSKVFKNETNKYELDLSPKDPSKTKYSSVEKLNAKSEVAVPKNEKVQSPEDKKLTVSGLTTKFWDSNISDLYLGDFEVLGEVKLEKIEKEASGENVYFHLVSATKNQPLKLVKTLDGNKKEEVLVSGIKATNLLATSLTIAPTKANNKTDSNFLDEVMKDETNKKHYTVKEDGMFLNIAKESGPEKVNNISIKPYQLEKADLTDTTKIDIEAIVSFGSEANAKTYRTSSMEDRKTLKEIGFKLDIYSKTLADTEAVVDGEKIKADDQKLDNYFKNENYDGFVLESTNATEETLKTARVTNGNYHIDNIKETELENLKLDVQKSKSEDNLESVDTNLPINVLVFAGYSYSTNKEEKVSLTPALSLIHIKAAQK